MSQAPAAFMRYDTMEQWLKSCGFTARAIRRMVEKGVIQGQVIGDKRRCWYRADQIEHDVLKNGKEARE